jgi:hypothetical protein
VTPAVRAGFTVASASIRPITCANERRYPCPAPLIDSERLGVILRGGPVRTDPHQRHRPGVPRRRPAAIGAILGAAILLARALHEAWKFAILAGTAIARVGPALAGRIRLPPGGGDAWRIRLLRLC